MNIELKNRTAQHVRIYYQRVQDPEIQRMMPQSVSTIEQALTNFANTQKTGASSYGSTIYVDGVYVGDIWCYGIAPAETPQAMVSYCIFEKAFWGKGVMSSALALFLSDIVHRFGLSRIGAFTFSANKASIHVLEKNGFLVKETFCEDGIESVYMEQEIATSLRSSQ